MINAFKKILNPDVLLAKSDDPPEIRFHENGKSNKVGSLFIRHVPVNSIGFSLDQPQTNELCISNTVNRTKYQQSFRNFSPYLNPSTKDINKRCDIILVGKVKDRYDAVLFELKSDNPDYKDAILQLNNSEVVLNFLLNLIHLHYGISCHDVHVYKVIGTTKPLNHTPRPTNASNKNLSKYRGIKIVHLKSVKNKKHTTEISFDELIKI